LVWYRESSCPFGTEKSVHLQDAKSHWSLRNKTNSPEARVPLAWVEAYDINIWTHVAIYFPTEEYFAKHPEYYALVNGKRQPSQLCNTNEDVIAER